MTAASTAGRMDVTPVDSLVSVMVAEMAVMSAGAMADKKDLKMDSTQVVEKAGN